MYCFRHVFPLLLSITMVALSGCQGSGGLPDGVESGTVSGVITSKGAALPEGCVICFLPIGGAALPATAAVGADGAFQLSLRDKNAIPTGQYKVTVQPPPLPPMTPEEEERELMEGISRVNEIDQIPAKYMSETTTPQTYEVVTGDNNVTIELVE